VLAGHQAERQLGIDEQPSGSAGPAEASSPTPPGKAWGKARQIRVDAVRRGVDFITLRGLAERLGIAAAGLADLQRQLASSPHLGDYTPPLWSVHG
jgi:hypothetical protein